MCYQIHWVSRFISTSAIIVTMDSKPNTCLYLICSPMNPMTAYAASAKNIFHRSARFFVTWLLMVTPSVQLVTKSSTKKIVQEIVLKVQTLKLSFCVGCRLLWDQFKVPAPNLLFEKKNDTSVTMSDLLQSHFDNCYHDRAAKYAMCGICGTGFSNYLPNPRVPTKVFIDPETKKPDPSLAEWEMVRHVVECKSQEFNNRQCQACRKSIAVNKSLRGTVSKIKSDE